jgi:hypothetical protein
LCGDCKDSKLTHIFFANDSLLFYQATMANCVEIAKILQQYEEASGQQLNRAKTSIFFTRNNFVDMKGQIQDLFQVPEIKNHEKYLGLPSFVGCSKLSSFGELKEFGARLMDGRKSSCLMVVEKF